MSSQVNPILATDGKVWFIQNISREGPGYFGELLQRWNIPFEVRCLEKGESLPEVGEEDAVIFLGGPMSANDKTKTMLALLEWVKGLVKRRTAYLGICLGLQVLVKAAGGNVTRSPAKEIGFRMAGKSFFSCTLTPAGAADPLFKRFTPAFNIFQLHGETVELIPGMTLLAEGKWCPNQIVLVGSCCYGIQGHLELNMPLLKDWIAEDDDLKHEDPQMLLKDWKASQNELHLNCRTVLLNFLKIAGIVG